MIRGNILVRNNKYDDHRFYHVLWKQQPDDIDTSFAIKATDMGRDFSALHLTALTLTLDSRKPENCILANQGDVICCQAIDMHYCKLHKSWKS